MRSLIFLLLFGLLFVSVSGCATKDRTVSNVLTETKTKRQSNIKCPKETIKGCINFRCSCYKKRY